MTGRPTPGRSVAGSAQFAQPWFQITVEQIEEAALVVPGSVEDQMVEAVLDVFASLLGSP
jgi:hypothetical protein